MTTTLDPMVSRLAEAANSECVRRDDQIVGTEYMLLGLLSMTPRERLEAAGIDCAAVAEAAEQMLAPHRDRDLRLLGPRGCQTPRAKHVLEAAVERATSEGRGVKVSDLWRGLLKDPDSAAVNLLKSLDLNLSALTMDFE